jgi:hypothetical protein
MIIYSPETHMCSSACEEGHQVEFFFKKGEDGKWRKLEDEELKEAIVKRKEFKSKGG